MTPFQDPSRILLDPRALHQQILRFKDALRDSFASRNHYDPRFSQSIGILSAEHLKSRSTAVDSFKILLRFLKILSTTFHDSFKIPSRFFQQIFKILSRFFHILVSEFPRFLQTNFPRFSRDSSEILPRFFRDCFKMPTHFQDSLQDLFKILGRGPASAPAAIPRDVPSRHAPPGHVGSHGIDMGFGWDRDGILDGFHRPPPAERWDETLD